MHSAVIFIQQFILGTIPSCEFYLANYFRLRNGIFKIKIRNSGQCFKRNTFTPQFPIFKPLSNCFEETLGFDVKTSFGSHPVSRLIR